MAEVAELLKAFLAPGAFWPLLAAATVIALAALAAPRKPKISLALFAAICAAYWLACVPAVAERVATGFGRLPYRPVASEDLNDIEAIVVLGAGAYQYSGDGRTVTLPSRATALNAFEAVRLFNLVGGRVDVVASGGIVDRREAQDPEAIVLRGLLTAAGVPYDRVVLEAASRTTHEQATHVAALLRSRGWRRVAVVTSPVHLVRAAGSFRVEGIAAVPAPAPFMSEHGGSRSRWLPNREAFEVSSGAIYDYVALVYYEMRGWSRLR